MENTVSDRELVKLRSSIHYAESVLSPAEILALNTTPKNIVGAPGAGNVLELISAVLILDWESAAYATNGNLTIKDETGTSLSNTVLLANLLAATGDKIVQMIALDTADTGLVLAENEALQLTCATGDPTAGDSPVRVKVSYRVHATGL